jgi:glutamate racemase
MLGIWDTGLGGLTVASAIQKRIPQLSFLYRGDHKNAPYGGRAAHEILSLVTAEADSLFRAGCSLVVLACNTASVTALRDLQQNWLRKTWPGRNVIGVVVPVVEEMVAMLPDLSVNPAAPTVQIFATDHTVRSQVFVTEIYKRAPGVRVVQTACSELVPAIEYGMADLEKLVAQYVAIARQHCAQPDYVILGCTHYPLIKDLFAREMPGVPILDQADAVAHRLESYLARHPEYHMDYSGRRDFITTGDLDIASRSLQKYFPEIILRNARLAA